MAHTHSHSHDDHAAERLSLGRLLFRIAFSAVVVGLLVAYSMSFQVAEGYNAVVTRFGEEIRPIRQAGLYWKWPWPIEQAHEIDVRRRLFNTPYTETFTSDKKNLVLLTYVVWRVEDPLLFLQSTRTREFAEQKLDALVSSKKNIYVAQYDLASLVSTDSENIKIAEIERKLLADVAEDASKNFGIRVEQVGVKRIAYPEENMPSVLEQMRAERRGEAERLRAQGEKLAQAIISGADVKAKETIAQGKEEAGKIRAGMQTKVAQIYEEATKLDPEFFEFWRSLRALKQILGPKATIILPTNWNIFQVLAGSSGPSKPETPRPQQAEVTASSDQAALSAAETKETP